MGNNGKKADDKARAMANLKLLKNASPANKKVITKILNEERKAKKSKDPVIKRLVTMRNELLAGKKSKKSNKKVEE